MDLQDYIPKFFSNGVYMVNPKQIYENSSYIYRNKGKLDAVNIFLDDLSKRINELR